MSQASVSRWIGLDVHKHYLVAIGVDAEINQLFHHRKVYLSKLDDWIAKHLTSSDAVVLEMSTNSFDLYDKLVPHVHSVTIVHPPHVKLITKARVKTDRKSALALATLHAKGLLAPVWVPSKYVRALRALVAQRSKMVRLSTQAKNRLHSTLHRHCLPLPDTNPFAEDIFSWWLALPLPAIEIARVRSDWATLHFADAQVDSIEQDLLDAAADDPRIPLLIQLPGISVIGAITLLAAIDDISRFPSPRKLVGYAGLGVCVHDSGQTHRTGRITKEGRRDIRTTVITAARVAVLHHPHWKATLQRLEPRIGYNKAIVAIARKLLVAIWHILTHHTADRFADPDQVARFFLAYAYRLGKARRPDDLSVAQFVRALLDQINIGFDLSTAGPSSRPIRLPPSSMQ